MSRWWRQSRSLCGGGLLLLCCLPALAAEMRQELAIFDNRSVDYSSMVKRSADSQRENLELRVSLPAKLAVPDQDLRWSIERDGVPVRSLQGNQQYLHLPVGIYSIHLQIGRYVQHKQVLIRSDLKVTPYFQGRIGRMTVQSDQPVEWLLSERTQQRFSVHLPATRYIDEWVPAGDYEIQTLDRDVPRQTYLHIQAGEEVSAEIKLPAGEVKLIAIRANQPLFRPVDWVVFRLENGGRREVGHYHLHSQGISIPPGNYEVVATHGSQVRSRQFQVRENTINKVVLPLDDNS